MDINSIAHELHHMVDHILETKAIHRGNNDETWAYLMWYYIEEILRKVWYGLKKLPKKRKKKVK